MAEPAAEALACALVEHRLADVPERRVADVVPEPDRLREVLVQPQRPGDGARDLRRLQRVGEPRAVVVALGRHEHLGLVLEPPERLRVHDPVAVALERRAQPAVRLFALPRSGIGARGERREVSLLPGLDPRGIVVGDEHALIVTVAPEPAGELRRISTISLRSDRGRRPRLRPQGVSQTPEAQYLRVVPGSLPIPVFALAVAVVAAVTDPSSSAADLVLAGLTVGAFVVWSFVPGVPLAALAIAVVVPAVVAQRAGQLEPLLLEVSLLAYVDRPLGAVAGDRRRARPPRRAVAGGGEPDPGSGRARRSASGSSASSSRGGSAWRRARQAELVAQLARDAARARPAGARHRTAPDRPRHARLRWAWPRRRHAPGHRAPATSCTATPRPPRRRCARPRSWAGAACGSSGARSPSCEATTRRP